MSADTRFTQLLCIATLLLSLVACSTSPTRPRSSLYNDAASYNNWHSRTFGQNMAQYPSYESPSSGYGYYGGGHSNYGYAGNYGGGRYRSEPSPVLQQQQRQYDVAVQRAEYAQEVQKQQFQAQQQVMQAQMEQQRMQAEYQQQKAIAEVQVKVQQAQYAQEVQKQQAEYAVEKAKQKAECEATGRTDC